MPYKIEVTVADESTAETLLRALSSRLSTEVRAEEGPPTDICVVCGGAFTRDAVENAPLLNGPACGICRDIAGKMYEDYWNAASRAWTEIKRQLPREVLSIRSGAEAPTFYRGFE
ncbi:MAG TPA: hypothetical protein VFI91_01520 [Longimicrobiaceae bacterium]|nr:hypothetical protein [Longimicrobiaceae bacterium]